MTGPWTVLHKDAQREGEGEVVRSDSKYLRIRFITSGLLVYFAMQGVRFLAKSHIERQIYLYE